MLTNPTGEGDHLKEARGSDVIEVEARTEVLRTGTLHPKKSISEKTLSKH